MASRSRPNSTDFRQLQGQIELWSRRGYVEDPRKALLDHYAKLEFADIEAFYAAQVAERPVIILVVGDPQRVDVGELARYGEVIEVRERELFAR